MTSIWLAITILRAAPHVLPPRQQVLPIARDACSDLPLTPWETLATRHALCVALRGPLP